MTLVRHFVERFQRLNSQEIAERKYPKGIFSGNSLWLKFLQELRIRSQIYLLKEVYRSSVNDPMSFWEVHKTTIIGGFNKELFASNWSEANICILIPFHNSFSKGFLGTIYSLAELQSNPKIKLRVLVISHNSTAEENEFLEKIVSEIGHSIELIVYETELQGPIYSTQLGVALLPKNIEFLGIIDADTLIPSNWLNSMLSTLEQNPWCVATVGPRLYVNENGEEILYGRIKVSLELILKALKSRAKLVYGNSFFRLSDLKQVVKDNFGKILNEGLIQEEIERNGGRVLSTSAALAISEGEKFDEPFLAVFARVLRNLKIFITEPSLSDHILFLLEDQYNRFPRFKQLVDDRFPRIQEIISRVRRGSMTIQTMFQLYQGLQQLYNQLNFEGVELLQQDLNRIRELYKFD